MAIPATSPGGLPGAPGVSAREPVWLRPWVLLGTALVLSAVSLVLANPAAGASFPVYTRLFPLFVGTVLAGIALQRRLGHAVWTFPQSIEPSAFISCAGLVAVAGYLSMEPAWLSGHMFYGALFLLAVVGSLLALLPSMGRRIVLSLLVLFHFTGMAVTITSVDPPGGQGPWLSKQLWTWVYRPYLSFLYLTNAYHFYSPDPGPPSLFWFAVHFDDGTYKWVKLPERSNSPIDMHYQRHLALPEHIYTPMLRLPFSAAEYNLIPEDKKPASVAVRGTWEEIYYRRDLGSTVDYIDPSLKRHFPIAMVLDVDVSLQYGEPQDTSKRLIGSLARRIYWKTRPDKEGVKVKSVKVYRIKHRILSPLELSQGLSPLDKTKHWSYFMGEFGADGRILDEKDPFLYWFLPIAKVPASYPYHGIQGRPGVPAIRLNDPPPKDGFLLDGLEMHAAGRHVREDKKP